MTASWYIFNYNAEIGAETGQILRLGQGFGPAQIVGTDPKDPNRWILAQQDGPGVITYWDSPKQFSQKPIPVYVYEWDPELRKVRELHPVYAYAAAYSVEPKCIIRMAGGAAVIIVGTAVIILDPIFGDEVGIPLFWRAVLSAAAGG